MEFGLGLVDSLTDSWWLVAGRLSSTSISPGRKSGTRICST